MNPEEISKVCFQSFICSFSRLLRSSNHHQQEIVAALLHESMRLKASDINIEPVSDDYCEIFFRINGILHKVLALSDGQATLLYEALQREAQDQRPGDYGVIEGTLTAQDQGVPSTFHYYSIPQSPTNSILIKKVNTIASSATNGNEASLVAKPDRNIDKKIFIWQVGKVGSSTVYRSLQPHTKPSKWLVPSIKNNNSYWPIHNNIIQTHSIKLLYDFLHYSEEEFVIISLVRDILARNISALFQSMNDEEEGHNDYFIASIDEFKKMPYEQQEYEITQHLRRLNTSTAVTYWYDDILKSHFYYPEINKYFIDIYAKPFDQEKGFQFYESKTPRIKMIILRLEDLIELKKTLGDFLGVDNFELVSKNMAAEKWYNPIYKRFKKRYKPTEQEIKAIYNSRFMTYFYSSEQIRLFIEKWYKAS